jgi:hypothetical protein
MSKTALPYRLIIDSFAIIKLHQMGENLSLLLYNMMYVNCNSLQHKKEHIITSQKSFTIILNYLMDKINPETIGSLSASIRPISIQTIPSVGQQTIPSIEEIDEETKRIWEYAVVISTDRPYQTIIITDSAHLPNYNTFKETDKKINIQAIDESSSVGLIENYFSLCRSDKQN